MLGLAFMFLIGFLYSIGLYCYSMISEKTNLKKDRFMLFTIVLAYGATYLVSFILLYYNPYWIDEGITTSLDLLDIISWALAPAFLLQFIVMPILVATMFIFKAGFNVWRRKVNSFDLIRAGKV